MYAIHPSIKMQNVPHGQVMTCPSVSISYLYSLRLLLPFLGR
ncbi:MAG: hypothetical protein VSS75_010895 [Candidatus Parabeggiatoa sp.]